MKKLLYCIISIAIISLVIIYLGTKENNVLIESKSTSKSVGSSAISMMYETEANSGVYEVSTDTVWPTDGYTFNETLSKCENGSVLTWNEENKTVLIQANSSDKCYIYFDIYDRIITFTIEEKTYYAENGMTWDEWLNSDYNIDEFYYDGNKGVYITTNAGSVNLSYYNNEICNRFVYPEDLVKKNYQYLWTDTSNSSACI